MYFLLWPGAHAHCHAAISASAAMLESGQWSRAPCQSTSTSQVSRQIFYIILVNTKVMAASIKPGGCGDWGGFIPQPDNILETGAGDLSLSELMRVNDTQP